MNKQTNEQYGFKEYYYVKYFTKLIVITNYIYMNKKGWEPSTWGY